MASSAAVEIAGRSDIGAVNQGLVKTYLKVQVDDAQWPIGKELVHTIS